MLSTFLNCVGLMPKGPCSSLSSLALQKGNISPPQVDPQKTRLYLKRASSQYTISMQNHGHRSTMEYIHTVQRSFVAPVPLQICWFLFCQSSLRQCCCLVKIQGKKGNEEQQTEKEKRACLCSSSQSVEKEVGRESVSPQLCISLRNRLRCAKKERKLQYFKKIIRYFVFYSSWSSEYVRQKRRHEGINYRRKEGGIAKIIKGGVRGFKTINHEH